MAKSSPPEAASPETAASTAEETALLRMLKTGTEALRNGDLALALRYLDRAWRHAPHNATILQLYGQVLLATGHVAAAQSRLLEAAERQSSPDIEAMLIETILARRQPEAAMERLRSALHRFAVAPDGALIGAARRVIASRSNGNHGWVGIAPTLELVGEIIGVAQSARLQFLDSEGTPFCADIVVPGVAGRASFRIPRLHPVARTTLTILADDGPLIGSSLIYPPSFNLDGRATTEHNMIYGWASLGWLPDHPLEIVLEDERGATLIVPTRKDPAEPLRHRFRIDRTEARLAGRSVIVSVVLPDGTTATLPDTPLILEDRAFAPEPPTTPGKRGVPTRQKIDIIVPVYGAREESVACLASLRETTGAEAEVIVVDDASPDEALARDLDGLASAGTITLLRNAANLGFPASVNRALRMHEDRDVVLVNSDTILHGDWLARLREAAYRARDIGTATPLTNRGSIVSYPAGGTYDCSAEEAASLDRLAAKINRGVSIDLPVGVGFCWYLRRDCLADTGVLDETSFGRGYGEDNDLSLRASRKGWRHVVAADIFVLHRGGGSFGPQRDALMERNRRLINLRYPGYDALVETHIADDPLKPVRRRLDEARLLGSTKSAVLLATLALPGGVDRLVGERCRALRDRDLGPIVLRPVSRGSSTFALAVEDKSFADLRYDLPEERPALLSLLRRLRVTHVEIHHFLDADPRVLEAVMALSAPYDVFIHDYSWICPRLSLIDGNGRYCGEPPVAACEACIKANGAGLSEPKTVAALRRRSARWLADVRRVIVPTKDVAARLARYFPDVAFDVEPWEGEVVPRAIETSRRADPMRIALIGAIGIQKGFQVVLDCARDAGERKLPIEFAVIGYTEDDDALLATSKAFVTGRYDEGEVQDLLRREEPDLVFFPSVTPETWCFTLSHALRSGLPIVAFDLGAIGERLREAGIGTLLAPTADARLLNDRLLELARQFRNARSHPHAAAGTARSLHMPPLNPSPGAPPQTALAASVQLLTVPPGLYYFFVRTAAPVRTTTASNLAFPAVHIALGPGMSPQQVEFFPGPRTYGTWLCEPGNTLVVKVSGDSVTLVLTSVRAPEGGELAIEVEQLDGRTHAPAGGSVILPPPPPIAQPVTTGLDSHPGSADAAAHPALRLRIVTHLRNRGDVPFEDVAWAGRIDRGVWIEAFTVVPLEELSPAEIEYKALTASGFETPWLRGGEVCGTRGMASPLVGFAMRLKPNGGVARHDCEYSGSFQSGMVVGPLKNGAPCRSSVPNDPLEGIQIRIVERKIPIAAPTEAKAPAVVGPRFSKLREEAEIAPVSDAPLKSQGGRQKTAIRTTPKPKTTRAAASPVGAPPKKRKPMAAVPAKRASRATRARTTPLGAK